MRVKMRVKMRTKMMRRNMMISGQSALTLHLAIDLVVSIGGFPPHWIPVQIIPEDGHVASVPPSRRADERGHVGMWCTV